MIDRQILVNLIYSMTVFSLRVVRGLFPVKLILFFDPDIGDFFELGQMMVDLYLNWGEFDSSFYWTILLHLAVNPEFYNFPPSLSHSAYMNF